MKKLLLLAAAAATFAAPASAAIITLTFEGLGNQEEVGDFYADQGIVFSPGSLALIDADAGGSGNTANEPSGQTVLFFLNANSAILNYEAGFQTGFSFFYSSNSAAASVTVWDDVGGTGNLLGTINLVRQYNDNCVGDPGGAYCNWTAAGINFNGIAKSIDFGGTANFIAFDNVTFGSDRPGGGGVIPEPATWAMLITGFGLVGATMRRRRVARVSA